MASKASKSTKSTRQPKKPAPKAPAAKAPARQPAKGRGSAAAPAGSPLLRPEVIGALLVVLAVFTLLSLLSGSRGDVTAGWWICCATCLATVSGASRW